MSNFFAFASRHALRRCRVKNPSPEPRHSLFVSSASSRTSVQYISSHMRAQGVKSMVASEDGGKCTKKLRRAKSRPRSGNELNTPISYHRTKNKDNVDDDDEQRIRVHAATRLRPPPGLRYPLHLVRSPILHRSLEQNSPKCVLLQLRSERKERWKTRCAGRDGLPAA